MASSRCDTGFRGSFVASKSRAGRANTRKYDVHVARPRTLHSTPGAGVT